MSCVIIRTGLLISSIVRGGLGLPRDPDSQHRTSRRVSYPPPSWQLSSASRPKASSRPLDTLCVSLSEDSARQSRRPECGIHTLALFLLALVLSTGHATMYYYVDQGIYGLISACGSQPISLLIPFFSTPVFLLPPASRLVRIVICSLCGELYISAHSLALCVSRW